MRRLGFKRFILGIGYNANFIKKYYDKHKIPGVDIVFSKENRPLGTGGAVKKAEALIKSSHFLVLNGDSYAKFDKSKFIKFYERKRANVLILLKKAANKKEFGEVIIDKDAKIICFKEKGLRVHDNFINAGVYLFNKKVFSMMPKGARFSLEYDFFPSMVGKGIYGYKQEGFFIDIGTPERYSAAKRYLAGLNKRG